MTHHFTRSLVLILAFVSLRSWTAALPEPGPAAEGVRLRLTVAPLSKGGTEGYDVRVSLINVTREAIRLRAHQWRSAQHEGGFQDFLEAAASIESYPAIEPWLGQVRAPTAGAAEPEYVLKPGETLTVAWQTTGRRLKNRVSNPLEVQNPEFTQNGLHSVHASLVLAVGDRSVRLRSNEQLVPIGGSRENPKHTYGPVWWAGEKQMTALLGLGALQQVAPGDQFVIQSGNIGMTWTLTVTNVQAGSSIGTLQPSQTNPAPAFPSAGAYAALLIKK